MKPPHCLLSNCVLCEREACAEQLENEAERLRTIRLARNTYAPAIARALELEAAKIRARGN